MDWDVSEITQWGYDAMDNIYWVKAPGRPAHYVEGSYVQNAKDETGPFKQAPRRRWKR